MNFFYSLFTAIGFCAIVFPAQAAMLSLAQISDYFNGLKTLSADFTQINSDGSSARGKLLIWRPGRMRFEYEFPLANLVLASSGQLAIFDNKSNQPPIQYPLGRTPLKVILQRTVNFQAAKMVTGHSYDGKFTRVVTQDPYHPEYGVVDLIFSDAPIRLQEWVLTDDTGSQTVLKLGTQIQGLPLTKRMFSISAEIAARGIGKN
ncbi:MAG: outer membrane lipoprotein-sorting protein [Paracoccaceae bacterium]|jgi:outer membrane lipoprotein-sorting protein